MCQERAKNGCADSSPVNKCLVLPELSLVGVVRS